MANENDGANPKNISTEHQPEGDAGNPGDTLDRPDEQVHEPREFVPGRDEGKAEPSGS